MKIKNIKKIEYKEDVYNLHIKDNHNYFANGLCVSNCHSLDSVASDFFSTKISRAVLMRLGVTREEAITVLENIHTVRNATDYSDFVKNTLIKFMSIHLSKMNTIAKNTNSSKDIELVQTIGQAINKWTRFIEEFEDDKNNWTFEVKIVKDFTKGKKRAQGEDETELEVQPVWVSKYLHKYIWSKYDHIILMSGTILNKELFSSINGINNNESTYICIPSPFPLENRKIYYIPIGKMSYNLKQQTFNKQIVYLEKILNNHNNDKGIIHSSTYEIAKWIDDRIDYKNKKRLLLPVSENKIQILEQHSNIDSINTVLLSPSMTEGVDLKDDLSRFQVLMKIPYPSLASEKIKKRIESNNKWYGWLTVTTIMQAMGRSVRSNKDYCTSYIIDTCFEDLMKSSGYFMPKWFKESIIKVNI